MRGARRESEAARGFIPQEREVADFPPPRSRDEEEESREEQESHDEDPEIVERVRERPLRGPREPDARLCRLEERTRGAVPEPFEVPEGPPAREGAEDPDPAEVRAVLEHAPSQEPEPPRESREPREHEARAHRALREARR